MNKAGVLLYYPRLNRFARERDYHWFPYSVLPLAQTLAAGGFRPVIVDRRVEPDPDDQLAQQLQDAVFVGISAMSGYQIRDGLEVARRVRALRPDLPIVWGGWHPTILPEQTVRHPLVDLVVVGRAERRIVELGRRLVAHGPIDDLAGIARQHEANPVFTGYPPATPLEDDAQQYENFIPIASYINPSTRAVGYFSGHGCAFRCGFCSRHFMTNRYSPYPVEKVLADIRYFKNTYGLQRVHFQDDNLFLDPHRALAIAEALVASETSITWWANVRADVLPKLKPHERHLLVQSGMRTLFIGVESASQRLLDLMNKGIAADDILHTAQVMRESRTTLSLSYMFGVPGDDLDALRVTVDQVATLRDTYPNVQVQTCCYQPYPGTELYDLALAWGYPRLTELEQWGQLQPQSELGRIPWLTDAEMDAYRNLFAQLAEAPAHV